MMRSRQMAGVGFVLAVALLLPACERYPEAAPTISREELVRRIEDGSAPLILDVRSAEEYAAGHLPGALNIPHDQLAERFGELGASPSDEIVVHCQSGRRARLAEEVLSGAGYARVRDLDGHMKGWREAGLVIE